MSEIPDQSNQELRAVPATHRTQVSRRSWLRALFGSGLIALGLGLLGAHFVGCRTAESSPSTSSSGATRATGQFLAISDVHLDPFRGLTREQFIALAEAPLAEWPQRLKSQPAPAYGEDSPFPLLQSSIADAKAQLPKPDFILFPGDFLAHGWQQKYDQLAAVPRSEDPVAYHEFTKRVLQLVAKQLQDAFPQTPILPVLGNDDSYCGDYMIGPDSLFLEMFSQIWEPIVLGHLEPESPSSRTTPAADVETTTKLRRDFRATVRRGGYYSLLMPRLKHHRLVALNTVFFAPQYSNACGDPTATPALDQFRWLEETLAAAQRHGEAVWLLMHIPPGIDEFATHRAGVPQPLWQPELTARFLQLLQRYENTIQMAFAGHTHMDDFRVVRLEGRPVLLTKIVPAVSPIFRNNPGYQTFQYDPAEGTLLNYTTYGLSLPTSAGGFPWVKEYDFASAYPTLSVEESSISRLGTEVTAGGEYQKRYLQYYSVSGPPTPVTNSILGCAISNTTVAEFTECFGPTTGK